MPHPLATHLALRVTCALNGRAWSSLFKRGPMFIDLLDCVGSVQDYWEGYKLFCYAYYSHSARHANDFRDSKLGALGLFAQLQLPFPSCAHCMFVNVVLLFLMLFFSGCMGPGQLVWRRLHLCPSPSPHVVRTTCMQLLPLVEMFCRWELQEDCSNLEVLMERFESVAELESHDLGRALLCMVRDEDDGFRSYSERRHPPAVPQATVDAFHEVRQRLAAVDIAFQGLQPQVHIVVGHVGLLAPPRQRQSALSRDFFFCDTSTGRTLCVRHCCVQIVIQFHVRWHICVCLEHLWVPISFEGNECIWFSLSPLCAPGSRRSRSLLCSVAVTLDGIVDVRCGRMKCLSVRPPHSVCTGMHMRALCIGSAIRGQSHAWSPCSLCRPHALLVLKFATSIAQQLIACPVRSVCGYVRATLPCRGGFAINRTRAPMLPEQ